MLLAIDVGNTNTVFSIHDGSSFLSEWRCATEHARTADQYYVWLRNLMQLNDIKNEIDRVVISSVVPQVVFNLRVLSDKYFDCRPIVVGKPETKLGVPVRVDEGTLVGADRLVNTVGAFDRYGGDLIVVDFGTATTFDVVGSEGQYLGGIIAPGINLSLKALHDMTSKLPKIEVSSQKNVIGKNTKEAMNSGVYFGYISLIEGLIERIEKELGVKTTKILTGGLANLFKDELKIEHCRENLTLEGLRLVYQDLG